MNWQDLLALAVVAASGNIHHYIARKVGTPKDATDQALVQAGELLAQPLIGKLDAWVARQAPVLAPYINTGLGVLTGGLPGQAPGQVGDSGIAPPLTAPQPDASGLHPVIAQPIGVVQPAAPSPAPITTTGAGEGGTTITPVK